MVGCGFSVRLPTSFLLPIYNYVILFFVYIVLFIFLSVSTVSVQGVEGATPPYSCELSNL